MSYFISSEFCNVRDFIERIIDNDTGGDPVNGTDLVWAPQSQTPLLVVDTSAGPGTGNELSPHDRPDASPVKNRDIVTRLRQWFLLENRPEALDRAEILRFVYLVNSYLAGFDQGFGFERHFGLDLDWIGRVKVEVFYLL
ncbi:hypothetical protein AAVH_26767 [Aphelenchoides avenae]|nr:hypothetical protein AAVH_26767 [Aphelenchus avenae]